MSVYGQLGEIKGGREVGKKTRNKMIWCACPICKSERWIDLRTFKKTNGRCQACYHKKEGARRKGKPHPGQLGELNGQWKGGRILGPDGYIRVRIYPDNFFFPMTGSAHYVLEHRLVMAKHLKRCLLTWEVVHHKNGNKQDNRLENLQLLPTSRQHFPSMVLQNKVKRLEKQVSQLFQRVLMLEAENVMLRTCHDITEEVIN